MSLTNEMTIVRWLQSNEKEIVVKNRQEIADILYTDIGLRISASSVNRFLGAAGITLRVGKNGRGPAGKSGNNSVERDVCLAKILRKIGLDLGVLSDEELKDLTLLVARRYGDRGEDEDGLSISFQRGSASV